MGEAARPPPAAAAGPEPWCLACVWGGWVGGWEGRGQAYEARQQGGAGGAPGPVPTQNLHTRALASATMWAASESTLLWGESPTATSWGVLGTVSQSLEPGMGGRRTGGGGSSWGVARSRRGSSSPRSPQPPTRPPTPTPIHPPERKNMWKGTEMRAPMKGPVGVGGRGGVEGVVGAMAWANSVPLCSPGKQPLTNDKDPKRAGPGAGHQRRAQRARRVDAAPIKGQQAAGGKDQVCVCAAQCPCL